MISRDGEDDVNSIRVNTTQTSSTAGEYRNTNTKPTIHSETFSEVKEPQGCDILILLKSCWSWFCGLDDNDDVHNELADVDGVHSNQRTVNQDLNEGHESLLQHSQERPLIKWILNINLVFLFLVEIFLFIVFSLPVKYTFWRS